MHRLPDIPHPHQSKRASCSSGHDLPRDTEQLCIRRQKVSHSAKFRYKVVSFFGAKHLGNHVALESSQALGLAIK